MSRKRNISKYLLKGLGEVLLIIIGILIAVNIDEWIKKSKELELRCIYLNELKYTFEYDINDVQENIEAFDRWNPQIHDLLNALRDNKLEETDSLYHKFGTVGNFIRFGQRSKTKIEELKYSNINLIKNRELKNNILLYQDDKISFIRHLETRYDLIGEDIRKYYAENFRGYNYNPAYPVDLEKIKKDNLYFSLVYQRLKMNYLLRSHYDRLIAEQKKINNLLVEEIEKTCK